jgi:futalosine hydrolase
MSFKILYVTATTIEADTLNKILDLIHVEKKFRDFEIHRLVTGVGSISTAWALMQWITLNGKPDLVINGGIAGSYKDEIVPGNVVIPYSDCFADAGIEDGDNFLTLSEAGLARDDEFPYKDGLLYADKVIFDRFKGVLKHVRAITVNSATGSESTMRKLLKKYNPDIETMEGATFFYICCRENIPFLALRAISNKVEKRNRNNWNIDLALNNLSEKIFDLFLTL